MTTEEQWTPLLLALFSLLPLLLLVFSDVAQLWAHDGFRAAEFADPDTAMRLAYLKEFDGTRDWAEGFFRRDNAPYGMFLHWTMPFNLLVLGLVGTLRMLGIAEPWHAAGFFAGPLIRLGLAPMAYWAARGILTPPISCLCAIVLVFSPFIANYAMFGTANHHALIYSFTILLAGAWFRVLGDGNRNRWAMTLGAIAGLGFWITFELGPVIAILFGYLALGWFRTGKVPSRKLMISVLTFSLVITVAWWVNPPYGGHDVIAFDHLSLPYLVISWSAVAACGFATRLDLNSVGLRLRYAVVCAGLCTVAWIYLFPQFRFGIIGQDNASSVGILALPVELLPLQTPVEFLLLLGPGLLAIGLCLLLKPAIPNRWLLLPVLAVFSVVGYRYYRLAGYLVVASTFVIAWAFDRMERQGGIARVKGRCSLAALGAFLVVATNIAAKIPHADFPGAMPKLCEPLAVQTALNDVAWLQASGPEPIVATEMLYTPFILYLTSMRTVAGSYHRDTQGVLDLFGIFQAREDHTPLQIMQRRGVQFILVCESTPDIAYQHFSSRKGPEPDRQPEDTFYNRLVHRQYPGWLKLRPWPEGTKTGLLLYQVDPARLEEMP